jgi:hypothetical protein
MKLLEFDTGILHPQTGQISPSVKMSIVTNNIYGFMQMQHAGKVIHNYCLLMLNNGSGPLVYGTIDELTTRLSEAML